jgi:hypothetical protein
MVARIPKDPARMYLVLGSQEIDLSDYTREANDRWLRVTPQDTWSSTLSRVRIARQEALERTLETIRSSGFPDRGSAFAKLLDSCGIEKKADVVLAAIQYMRSVEKESVTQPRDLRRLIEETRKWPKSKVKKWNITLNINRMLEGGSPGRQSAPFLEHPRRRPRKNSHVILTEAGRDHLDLLSLNR